jgi:hypothetical protein
VDETCEHVADLAAASYTVVKVHRQWRRGILTLDEYVAKLDTVMVPLASAVDELMEDVGA